MKKFLHLLPAVLSAVLLWAAYVPMNETSAIFFALVPMLVVSRRCSPKRSALLWFVCGVLFWGASLAWMPAIVKNNGPLPLVLLGWAGLAALSSSYFALFGWLSARAWRAPLPRLVQIVLLEPVLWAGTEWLRGTLFTGFAWNFLGTAVASLPSLATPARLGGAYLVSALVVLLNGVFATLACRVLAQMRREEEPLTGSPRRLRLVRALETGLPLALILCVFALSARFAPASSAVPLKVALVQRNAPCIFVPRPGAETPGAVFDQLLQAATVAQPDLVVWGESAIGEFRTSFGRPGAEEVARHIAALTGGASLLAGGDWWFTVDGKEGPERRGWDAAGLQTVTPSNVVLQVYGKQHLVPFGEYIPYDKWIPVLQKLSPIGVSLWPGEAKVFTLPLKAGGVVRLAPLICFEDTDPTLARKAAKLGAQAIVLITNDSWFSFSKEPEQHAAQAVLRAVETGLPVIRVGNSGVTGVISPTGRTRWLEDGDGRPLVDAAGTMLDTVPLPVDPVRTPYTVLGDAPLLALFLLALAVLFVPLKNGSRAGAVSSRGEREEGVCGLQSNVF